MGKSKVVHYSRKARSPGFFFGALGLQLRLLRRRLPALLCMVLAVPVLAGAVAAAGAGLLGEGRFGAMAVAVAAEDDDARLDTLLRLAAGLPDVSEYARVHRVGKDEALQMVRDGRVVAALLLPEGFLDSVFSGENRTPSLVVDASRPVEAALLEQLARGLVQMLASAQQGIAYTLAVYDLHGAETPDRGDLIAGINLDYIQWLLASDGMIRNLTVNATGQLSVFQHYLLCAALFFMLLCAPVFYRLFALGGKNGWAARLKTAGCPLWQYALAQLTAGGLGVLLVEGLLFAGIGVAAGSRLAPRVGEALLGALLSAVFITCFAYLCSNLGGMASAAGASSLLGAFFLLAGGGLLPRALLPRALAALEPFSPIRWMMRALGPLFGVRADGGALMLLGAGCLTLLAGCAGVSLWAGRRRGTA